jgi:hypothetical protein
MGIEYDQGEGYPDAEFEEPEQSDALVDVASASAQAQAQHEIQSALIIARKFRRNEDLIYQKFVHGSCKRIGFALLAEYAFKRGRKQDGNGNWVDNIVSGATVRFMRELTRHWGNMRHGSVPIADTDEKRQVIGFAWDLETNNWIQQGAIFEKMVQRKVDKVRDGKKVKETEWVSTDERETRELNNKFGSTAERNCLQQCLPPDFIEDGLAMCKATIKAALDPNNKEAFNDVRKRIIAGFAQVNVPIDEVATYIGHSLDQCTVKEMEILRGIYSSIKDNQTTWADIKATKKDELPTEIQRKPGNGNGNGGNGATTPSMEDNLRVAREAQAKQDKGEKKGETPKMDFDKKK